MIGVSGSVIWSENPMELIFNPRGKFRWSPEGPVSQIHSPYLHAGCLGIFSDLLRSDQMLNRECDAESNGKLPYLFIPSKTATLIPKFAVCFGQNCGLCAWIYSEIPALGQINLMMMMIYINFIYVYMYVGPIYIVQATQKYCLISYANPVLIIIL